MHSRVTDVDDWRFMVVLLSVSQLQTGRETLTTVERDKIKVALGCHLGYRSGINTSRDNRDIAVHCRPARAEGGQYGRHCWGHFRGHFACKKCMMQGVLVGNV